MGTPTDKKPKMTARQELINQMINGARNEVIFSELHRDFFKQLKEKVEKGDVPQETVDMVFNPATGTLDDAIARYDAGFQISLLRLNYFKDLRKADQDKNAVKMAEKIRQTIPNEIQATVVDSSEE